MHPSTEAILRHFDHSHLEGRRAKISALICKLAHDMADQLDGPELTAGLRELLRAKDCFVRAAVEQAR